MRPSSSWTCRPLSTQSTTTFCVVACRLVWFDWLCTALVYDIPPRSISVCPPWPDEVSSPCLCVGSRMAQCWGRSYSCFIQLYTADLIALVERHGFCPHLYADDSQVYGSCRPSAIADFQLRLSACIYLDADLSMRFPDFGYRTGT